MQKSQFEVNTDVGIAEVFHQGPRAKTYKCPLCEYSIDGEWHYVVRPKSNHDLRRHIHKECVDAWVNQKLEIKLIPHGKFA